MLETRTRFKEDCDGIQLPYPLKFRGSLETRTRFKEDCDLPSWPLPQGREAPWLETRTRFKEDCDSPSTRTSETKRWRSLLETRTRFKEDCDSESPEMSRSPLLLRLKPGLASKRIATRCQDAVTCLTIAVGNQDSLQRGLRPSRRLGSGPNRSPSTLETRTRFKEDCDGKCPDVRIVVVSCPLETRTRFKEDCDRLRSAPPMRYRHSWKPGLASKRIATRDWRWG